MTGLKKISIILSLLIIVTTMGGCQKMSEKKMKSTAEDALRVKYDEDFKVIEAREFDDESFYAWLRPDSRPEIIVRAEMYNDGSALYDNYVVKTITHNISESVELLMKDYVGDYYVFTKNIIEYTDDENIDDTPQKHLDRNPGDRFDIAIFISEETIDAETLYNSIADIKSGIGFTRGSINPIIVSEDELVAVQSEIENIDELSSDVIHEIIAGSKRILIDLDASEAMPSSNELRKELGI